MGVLSLGNVNYKVRGVFRYSYIVNQEEPQYLSNSHTLSSHSSLDPGRSVAKGSAAGVTAGKWPEGRLRRF